MSFINKTDRFELEERISQIHNFSSQLRDLAHSILEHDLSEDETVNIIEGIAGLIDNHGKITFDIFTQVLELDKYHANARDC